MSHTFSDNSDSDSDIRLNPQARRKVPFYGTVEKTQFVASKENQNTMNRRAAVHFSKNSISESRIG